MAGVDRNSAGGTGGTGDANFCSGEEKAAITSRRFSPEIILRRINGGF